jgi:hypothetical protein
MQRTNVRRAPSGKRTMEDLVEELKNSVKRQKTYNHAADMQEEYVVSVTKDVETDDEHKG